MLSLVAVMQIPFHKTSTFFKDIAQELRRKECNLLFHLFREGASYSYVSISMDLRGRISLFCCGYSAYNVAITRDLANFSFPHYTQLNNP